LPFFLQNFNIIYFYDTCAILNFVS